MANDITENLFKSIDTIIAARIENLPYDQTIKCKIENAENAEDGKYIVSYQGNELTVFSERDDFQEGEYVYVFTPQSDYTQEKYIIGKVINENTNQDTSTNLVEYVQVTDNFNEDTDEEYQMLINEGIANQETELELFTKTFTNSQIIEYAGYDLLNVKASISTTAKPAIAGDYGLKIEIKYYDQSTGVVKSNEAQYIDLDEPFLLTTDDMIASNMYYTNGYCNQSKVFNISNKIIKTMTVSLYQKNNFTNESGSRISQNNKYYISITNLQISFGYNISNFTDSTIDIIYTPDGLLYNSQNYTKRLYNRLLTLSSDSKSATIIDQSLYFADDDVEVQWWKFDSDSSAKKEPLNEVGYSYLSNEIYTQQSLSTLSNVEIEAFMGYFLDKRSSEQIGYKSNSLKFYNNDFVESSEIIDKLKGLSLSFLESECGGVYNLYNKANQLMTDTLYHIKVQYNSVISNRTLKIGDTISWTIPAIKTMIQAPRLGNEYTSSDSISKAQNNGVVSSYTITHTFVDGDILTDNSFLLPFNINQTYNQNYTNNTIKVKIIIDSVEYESSVDLSFGPSGTTEAEYTFTLSLLQIDNEGTKTQVPALTLGLTENIYVKPQILDYRGEEVDIDISAITLSWLKTYNNIEYSVDLTLGLWKINFKSGASSVITDYGYDILKAEIPEFPLPETGTNDTGYKLIAYLPIAVRSNNSYKYICGPTTITYDITGKKATYTNTKYSIPEQYQKINTSYEWSYNKRLDVSSDGWPYFTPSNPELQIASIYQKDVQYISVKCDEVDADSNHTTIWVQPVLITQNKYPIPMYNGEAYELPLTNTNNSDIIKQTMVGRVSATGANVSGMFIGIIGQTDGTELMGLYGYKNGQKFFTLDENGKIYLNGSANDAETNPDPDAINMTITNSIIGGASSIDTSGQIKSSGGFVGSLTGNATTATTATNYSSTGGIADVISDLYEKIASLQSQINNLK